MASLALSMRMCRARNVACSRECAVRRCANGSEADGRRDARRRSFSLCREGKAAVLGRQPQAERRREQTSGRNDSWRGFGTHFQFCRPAARACEGLTSSFRGRPQRSRIPLPQSSNTVAMAPKKAPVRAPQENVSLGPQVREGKNRHTATPPMLCAEPASTNIH